VKTEDIVTCDTICSFINEEIKHRVEEDDTRWINTIRPENEISLRDLLKEMCIDWEHGICHSMAHQ